MAKRTRTKRTNRKNRKTAKGGKMFEKKVTMQEFDVFKHHVNHELKSGRDAMEDKYKVLLNKCESLESFQSNQINKDRKDAEIIKQISITLNKNTDLITFNNKSLAELYDKVSHLEKENTNTKKSLKSKSSKEKH